MEEGGKRGMMRVEAVVLCWAEGGRGWGGVAGWGGGGRGRGVEWRGTRVEGGEGRGTRVSEHQRAGVLGLQGTARGMDRQTLDRHTHMYFRERVHTCILERGHAHM